MAIRVTVWNEYLHEVQFPEIAEVYPKGIHGCIADFLKEAGLPCRTALLYRYPAFRRYKSGSPELCVEQGETELL